MRALPAEISLRRADGFHAVPPQTFYRIAKLRQEIFVIEQDCVYLDLDGRDLEDETIQVWAETEDGRVASSVRILNEDAKEAGLRSIGRVVTAPIWRGRGIAAAVMQQAIDACDGHSIMIHAQSHLADWYSRFGFATSGPGFLEDGIPHTPMRIR